MSTWWLAQHVITTGLLVAGVAILGRCWSTRPALVHALWVVVLIKFMTPPLIVWPWRVEHRTLSRWQEQPAEPAPLPIEFSPEPVPFVEPAALPPAAEPDVPLMTVAVTELVATDIVEPPDSSVQSAVDEGRLSWEWLPQAAIAVWLIGGVLVAVAQCCRIRRHWSIVRDAAEAPASLVRDVQDVAATLDVRPIPVVVSRHIASPCVWCVGRLRLLWPERLAGPADVARCRGVLAHELAHVRRRDHWVAWLELVAGVVWWWNPLYWFVRRRLRETAEMACDALALSVLPEGRVAYAEVFLELSAGIKAAAPAPALGAIAGTPQSFERRFSMILSEQVPARLSRLGLLAVCVLGLIALPGWSQAQLASGSEEPTTPSAPVGLPPPTPAIVPPVAAVPPTPPDSKQPPLEARLQKIEATLGLILKQLDGAAGKAGTGDPEPTLTRNVIRAPIGVLSTGKTLGSLVADRRRYVLQQENDRPSLTAIDADSDKLIWRSDLSDALKLAGGAPGEATNWVLTRSPDSKLLQASAIRTRLTVNWSLDVETGKISQVTFTLADDQTAATKTSRSEPPPTTRSTPQPATPLPRLPAGDPYGNSYRQGAPTPSRSVLAPQGQPASSQPVERLPAAVPTIAVPATTSTSAAPAMTQVDLVNLATSYIDAQGELKLARSRHARLKKLADGRSVSAEEVDAAVIQLETAEQKASLLGAVAKTAYEAAAEEVAHLQRLQQQGFASSGTLAAARGRLSLLESILKQSATEPSR